MSLRRVLLNPTLVEDPLVRSRGGSADVSRSRRLPNVAEKTGKGPARSMGKLAALPDSAKAHMGISF